MYSIQTLCKSRVEAINGSLRSIAGRRGRRRRRRRSVLNAIVVRTQTEEEGGEGGVLKPSPIPISSFHCHIEDITKEQRKRAEANRLAALAKRKALAVSAGFNQEVWKLFKCRKVSTYHQPTTTSSSFPKPKSPPAMEPSPCPLTTTHLPEKFRVKLEVCSPDSFSATPEVIDGFPLPGEAVCLQRLSDCLSNVVPSHYTQNHGGGKASVYKLADYEEVLRCLKNCKSIEYEEIPWGTYNVVERLSHSFVSGRWIPCRPEHLSDEKVDELIGMLPKRLRETLLPFQLEGVRFGLRRGGRCLIADEMGLGKTLQAIAIAGCFMGEGSILVVCPAILRYSWAEELERWLPLLPSDIHLVCGHQNNPAHLTRCPRFVVTSYKMLHRLRKSMLEREWAILIVDESHHVRCTKKKSEPGEIKAVLDVATKVKRSVLLSGTPSLSRPYDIFHQINMLWPGLLGRSKYEFAKTYCSLKYVQGRQGKFCQDFSKGSRLEELNVLLNQTVMIRRLKENVMAQLPPKRRQIISLALKKSDILSAAAHVRTVNADSDAGKSSSDGPSDISDKCDDEDDHLIKKEDDNPFDPWIKLSDQEVGVAKLSGFCKWLSIHPIVTEVDGEECIEQSPSSHKMIIFAHHRAVLDGVQKFICEKGIGFVRIDGKTLDKDRQSAIQSFQFSKEIKIAIIGILAGGSGLNLTAAQSVVFLELPKEPSLLIQAEDRAHRQGQTMPVNIYIFCAKDTLDESRWQALNKSMHRVTTTTNGKHDAIQEIQVEGVYYLETSGEKDEIIDNMVSTTVTSSEISDMGLVKCPNTCFRRDQWTAEAFGEINEKINKRCEDRNETYSMPFSETRFPDMQADNDSHLETEKQTCFNGELKETVRDSERESLRVSAQISEESAEQDLKEKDSIIIPEATELIGGRYAKVAKASAYSSNLRNRLQLESKGCDEWNRCNSKFSPENTFCNQANIVSQLKDDYIVLNGGSEEIASKSETKTNIKVSETISEESGEIDQMNEDSSIIPEATELNACGSTRLAEASSCGSFRVNSLRFEVSQYTGRIHLYSCIPGTDSRPRPLFENFRPEEVHLQNSPVEDSKKTSYKCIKDIPIYRHIIMAFIMDWNKLRPIERRKLLAKPLQLPLSVELCCLQENLNHDNRGLLKARSKRRSTPRCEISHPLPSNAIWKKVYLCSSYRKEKKEYTQGWTFMGEPLCKFCQTLCMSNNAKTPEFFEDLFCNLDCYEEYRLRTSSRYIREALFKIEHGVCSNCQLDCHKLVRHIRPLSCSERESYIKKVAPKLVKQKKLFNKLVCDPTEGNSWHADHIVPVYQGGGECRLENMRTLCVACHADVTAAQRAERRITRAKAKKQLKVITSTGQLDAKTKNGDQLALQDHNMKDELLLVKVPGSAYSVSGDANNGVQAPSKNPSLEDCGAS